MNENVTYIMSEKKFNLISIAVSFLAFFLTIGICLMNVGFAIVSGVSMVPTFENNDVVMFRANGAKSLEYDDIIILLPNDTHEEYIHSGFNFFERTRFENQTTLIKRVIGLPGDTIEIHDGYAWRNGEKLEAPYTAEGTDGEFGPYLVEEGKVFCLGDNRNYSGDSRAFGAFSMSGVAGKVLLHN